MLHPPTIVVKEDDTKMENGSSGAAWDLVVASYVSGNNTKLFCDAANTLNPQIIRILVLTLFK
jgi:hypothetical protein